MDDPLLRSQALAQALKQSAPDPALMGGMPQQGAQTAGPVDMKPLLEGGAQQDMGNGMINTPYGPMTLEMYNYMSAQNSNT